MSCFTKAWGRHGRKTMSQQPVWQCPGLQNTTCQIDEMMQALPPAKNEGAAELQKALHQEQGMWSPSPLAREHSISAAHNVSHLNCPPSNSQDSSRGSSQHATWQGGGRWCTRCGLDVGPHRAACLNSLAEGHHALPAAEPHSSDVRLDLWHARARRDGTPSSSHGLGHQPATLQRLAHHLRCQEQTCIRQQWLRN